MATNQTDIVNDLVDNVRLLLSSDTSLESLKEIDLCVKQNRIDLESIELSKIIGLEEALSLKVNITDIVDNLLSTLVNTPLSANQGRVLSQKIDVVAEAIEAIKTILASDDTTLDELQEIVNYIKQNKDDLSNLDLSNIAETNELKHFTKELKEKLENLPTKSELKNFTVPIGMIFINPSSVIPEGFFECNGAEISRIEYKELFEFIGTTYGVGNDITTFNLPDLRGEFVRGFDNGRGVDIDRTIGSFQEDEFKEHIHQLSGSGHTSGNGSRVSYLGLNAGRMNTTIAGGSETRPRNIAMMYCIKY